ncbi:MAG: hypothetical protein L0154_15290 [Chloroflexi bacterium]|nr:hypothetical protein [Chloroflexota bacterium]
MKKLIGPRYLVLMVLLVVLLSAGNLKAATNPTLEVSVSVNTGDCATSIFQIDFSWLSEVNDQDGYDVVGIIAYDANGTRIATDWNGWLPGMQYPMATPFGHDLGINAITVRPIYIEMYDITSFPPIGYNTNEIYDHILNQVNNGAPLLLSMLYDPTMDVPDCASLPYQPPLLASAACIGEDLEVAITDGNEPFEVTSSNGSAPGVPANIVSNGPTVISGPGKWNDLTITETLGIDSSNLGNFRCRPAEHPVPLSPAHRSRTTNPNPGFAWKGLADANNYRLWLYSETVNGLDFELLENTGGATSYVPVSPLIPRRYFWRVRGRVNNIWSRWSARFTLFIDPPVSDLPAVQQPTPVPAIDLAPPNSRDDVAPPPITLPPTIAPPNSR